LAFLLVRKMKNLLYGVGLNDANYQIYERVNGRLVTCAFYDRWRKMLTRCYSEKYHAKRPTYIGCSVCDEWLTFSNFKAWMQQQDWHGKDLDKDILLKGNKIYSPDVCIFVDPSLNNFLTDRVSLRGEWPLGVSWSEHLKRFEARCSNPFKKKQERIGYFKCPDKAHQAWRIRKQEIARQLAIIQKDERLKIALELMFF